MKKKKKRGLLNLAIWMTVALTTALLLLTGGVVAMRMGGYIPSEADIIFLVPRTPSASIEDNKGEWDEVGAIDIFKAEQINAAGDVVVQSAKTDDVIAPGTLGNYSFYLRNEGNVALDYNISFTAKLVSQNIRYPSENFPFLFRMYDQNGDYAVGDKDTWVTVDQINEVLDKGIVGKNAYYRYTLEWYWPFENGDDGMDTYFGNQSSEHDLLLSLKISTYAQESINPDATGGTNSNGRPPLDVGDINPWTFGLLVASTLGAIILLAYLLYKRFREKRLHQVSAGALAAAMVGVGSALSVMYYKMFGSSKRKK